MATAVREANDEAMKSESDGNAAVTSASLFECSNASRLKAAFIAVAMKMNATKVVRENGEKKRRKRKTKTKKGKKEEKGKSKGRKSILSVSFLLAKRKKIVKSVMNE